MNAIVRSVLVLMIPPVVGAMLTGHLQAFGCTRAPGGEAISGSLDSAQMKTDSEWRNVLTPAQYYILRQAGTERPYTGNLDGESRKGTYLSAATRQPVFRSEQKFHSGTGWPSFWAPVMPEAVVLRWDYSLPGEARIEVLDRSGSHLGHVFDDGPPPTGKRFCINAGALLFVPDSAAGQ